MIVGGIIGEAQYASLLTLEIGGLVVLTVGIMLWIGGRSNVVTRYGRYGVVLGIFAFLLGISFDVFYDVVFWFLE